MGMENMPNSEDALSKADIKKAFVDLYKEKYSSLSKREVKKIADEVYNQEFKNKEGEVYLDNILQIFEDKLEKLSNPQNNEEQQENEEQQPKSGEWEEKKKNVLKDFRLESILKDSKNKFKDLLSSERIDEVAEEALDEFIQGINSSLYARSQDVRDNENKLPKEFRLLLEKRLNEAVYWAGERFKKTG